MTMRGHVAPLKNRNDSWFLLGGAAYSSAPGNQGGLWYYPDLWRFTDPDPTVTGLQANVTGFGMRDVDGDGDLSIPVIVPVQLILTGTWLWPTDAKMKIVRTHALSYAHTSTAPLCDAARASHD
jgi:hypothetical protein